ncbi:MAG: CU044_2847 family protein [Cyanobacteria bacterium P01_C01_bin.89]
MATKLIQLEDGMLVEVETEENEAKQISSRAADAVKSSFEKIKPLLKTAIKPIAEVWKDLDQEVEIESAEVTINFSFEGEGNIYVTKAKAGSNLSVKLVVKPKR